MKVSTSQTLTLRLEKLDGLDPITVFLQDFDKGVGCITIICWGKVWTSFWGAMGNRTISEFFLECDMSYALKNLRPNNNKRSTKVEEEYLARIISAVQDGIRASQKEPKPIAQPSWNAVADAKAAMEDGQ